MVISASREARKKFLAEHIAVMKKIEGISKEKEENG